MPKNPSDQRPRPPTPEHERPEVIQHEPADWNGYRSSSSRGQLMRDFIEQGFPYERAKERVEEEFAARNPVVRPPRSGTSHGSTAGSSRTSTTGKPSGSSQKKPSSRAHIPSAGERLRLRVQLINEGYSIDAVNEMMGDMDLSDSETSKPSQGHHPTRNRSPRAYDGSTGRSSSPVRRGRSPAPYSTSNASGGNSRYRSPSPEFDSRPPVAVTTIEMLRQELISEGREPDWIELVFGIFCGAKTDGRNILPPASARKPSRRVRTPPPDACPLGKVWTETPAKDRNNTRISLVNYGFPPSSVKKYLDLQFGPETDEDRENIRLWPVNARQLDFSHYTPDMTSEREKLRQRILEHSAGFEHNETGIKLLLDDLFGPESVVSRAMRNPGPDWVRIMEICLLRAEEFVPSRAYSLSRGYNSSGGSNSYGGSTGGYNSSGGFNSSGYNSSGGYNPSGNYDPSGGCSPS
ncbi:hypothetical protein DL98DRAFT_640176 [Cadophora sp. DSE1049]|nr:hypothetical protein DL98DRAFT_640176 [Cadophora sp. DSE1049]